MSAALMAGYINDVAYTLGFYRELAPSFLDYVCVLNGVEGLPRGRRLRYCELGCGRGYGTALLAAANPDIDFVGIDFNPAHIGEARGLAEKAGLPNISFVEASFGDAAASADLGEFDMVTLHGVYTWVDAEARRDVVRFLRTRLVSGGIAYVSYNTLPGWAAASPLQNILKEYSERATGDSLAKVSAGMRAVQQLAGRSSAYFAQNPAVKTRFEGMAKKDVPYLAHEFLNPSWAPIYVTEAFRDFAEAKLTYVGSASILENRPPFAVPRDTLDIIGAVADLGFRELLKDYASNQQFRRDVYVKGPIRLTPDRHKHHADAITLVLTRAPVDLPAAWQIPAGEARLRPGLAQAAVKQLEAGPTTWRRIVDAIVKKGFSETDAGGMIDILIHNSYVVPARRDKGAADRSASQRLNAAMVELALPDDTHRFLASPVSGSAIGTNVFERLALQILLKNEAADAATLAGLVVGQMEKAGKHMKRNGKPIGSDDPEVVKLAEAVKTQAMPIWRDLGIVG